MIPCINAEGVAGLYDLMAEVGEKVFYTSINGEEFLTETHRVEVEKDVKIVNWQDKYNEYMDDYEDMYE